MAQNKLLDEIYITVEQANKELARVWRNSIVFTWRWWVQLGLTIIPWFIWVRYSDKDNIFELLFVGLVVAVTTGLMDTVGVNFNLWHYDWKVLPYVPIYFPWNYTLFPVLVMFLLQIKSNSYAFIKAIIFAGLSTFVFEPIFSRLGMYHLIKWKNYYSFVIYIPLYLFFNYIYTIVVR
jgi:hypothetical protein